MQTASALAHPNIAFIKYWGNRDPRLRIPASGSISMNLAGLNTQTRVSFDPEAGIDRLEINQVETGEDTLGRARIILDHVRRMAGIKTCARVASWNNFPTGTGIASSASGFAALAAAAAAAAGLDLDEADLSRLARRASGSACRSIPPGFVEWQAGTNDRDSFAFSIAPAEHWQLADLIVVVSSKPKTISSFEGHDLAKSSPLQAARLKDSGQRLHICRAAIQNRDFAALAEVVELDSNLMHAVMMTSNPPLYYWLPETLRIMHKVIQWRQEGIPVCFTIDAGPNIHLICEQDSTAEIISKLKALDGIETVICSKPGGPTEIIEDITPV